MLLGCRSLGFAGAILLLLTPKLVAEQQALNEPPAGFVALFNGRNLDGWKGLVGNPTMRSGMSPDELAAAQERADQSMREHWQPVDGILVFDGHGENLCTAKDYENFELYVDWKIERQGDSGICLRGSPQVQIWDPFAVSQNNVGSGGLFNNRKHADEPLVRADRPAGQWNTFYIMMMGHRVSVKLNGKLVVDNVELENYWERHKPIYPRGAIELQGHGSPLCFRNIFLRELPPTPSPPWEILFDGTNLDRWDYQRRGWRIEDSVLTASRRRRNRETENSMWTKERFGDFVLELDFKVSPDCESGILIRTDNRQDWLHTGLEIQIRDSYGRGEMGKQDCGAVRDLMAPWFDAARPPEKWNHMRIVAQDNLVSVVLNHQRVIDLDLNLWTQPGQNPDGSPNPLDVAGRNLKRAGFIGLQDQGRPVWFRNVRIKRLN